MAWQDPPVEWVVGLTFHDQHGVDFSEFAVSVERGCNSEYKGGVIEGVRGYERECISEYKGGGGGGYERGVIMGIRGMRGVTGMCVFV